MDNRDNAKKIFKMKPDRKFTFRTGTENSQTETTVLERNLTKPQVELLAGQVIVAYEDVPAESQEIIKNHIEGKTNQLPFNQGDVVACRDNVQHLMFVHSIMRDKEGLVVYITDRATLNGSLAGSNSQKYKIDELKLMYKKAH